MNELRNIEQVRTWLSTSLQLRRTDGEMDASQVVRIILACSQDASTLPPPAMMVDIAMLLHGHHQTIKSVSIVDNGLRSALVAYNDDVLTRIVQSTYYDDLLAAFLHVPDQHKALAVAFIVNSICARAKFEGVVISTGVLRSALAQQINNADLDNHPDMVTNLTESYLALARSARQCRHLIDDKEIFVLDHLDSLSNMSGRMTVEHVFGAADVLGKSFPRRLPPNRQRGINNSNLQDDSLYPAGGFSSMVCGGSNANVENLVTSELAYMEDGFPDIFTIKYVEGELLYYTRDDSVFRRHKHIIHVVLDSDLDDARVKDRGLPWQRIVLVIGLMVATIKWLITKLNEQTVTIHIAFPKNKLIEERKIVSLLLEAEILRGSVIIEDGTASEMLDKTKVSAKTAMADMLVISSKNNFKFTKGVRISHLNVSNSVPTIDFGTGQIKTDASKDLWAGWKDSAEDLLRWLV